MLRARLDVCLLLCAAIAGGVSWLSPCRVCGQFPNPLAAGDASADASASRPGLLFDQAHQNVFEAPPAAPAGRQQVVVDVQVRGNKSVSVAKTRGYLKTRPGRAFEPEMVQGDVRRLTGTGLFADVRTYTQQTPDGVVVTFEVFERPIVRHVRFVGNRAIKSVLLEKQTGLKIGDALNVYAVEEARRKVEQFYHKRGFPKARVTIAEGDKPQDAGVALMINEGPKHKILYTGFTGNTIASDARLRTQVKAKPGIMWLIKGQYDKAVVDEDVQRLTAYYRALGYFRAQVGYEVHDNDLTDWVRITYVIDEGPQYQIRNVAFLGNRKYTSEQLADLLQLKSGEPFNLAKMHRDVRSLRDLYGSKGHVLADVQADPRFLEEPGQLDLVFNVSEGQQFRVGRVDVNIGGDNPHTRRSVVLTRLSQRPGDIVDSRQIDASERRIVSSQLFANEPFRGVKPELVVKPSEWQQDVQNVAEQQQQPPPPDAYRGQSPEPAPADLGRQSAWPVGEPRP